MGMRMRMIINDEWMINGQWLMVINVHQYLYFALHSYAGPKSFSPPGPLGLPSWPALLACWACLGPCTASLGLSTACLGLNTAIPGLQDCLEGSLRTAKTAASCDVLLKYVHNSCQFPQNSWSAVLLSPDGDICNTSIYIYMYIYICLLC